MASPSKENGMFGKGKSIGAGWKAQSLQRSALARPTTALRLSQTISSLSSEMRVVGKIVCKGVLKIYGLVEGEVNESRRTRLGRRECPFLRPGFAPPR